MRRILAWIFLVCTLACECFIFWQSSRTGVESSHESRAVTVEVAPMVRPDYPEMSARERNDFLDLLEQKVRIWAHGIEFAGLCFFGTLTLLAWDRRFWLRVPVWVKPLAAFSAAALCGLLDETYQRTVSERGFEWADVRTDAQGALVGCLCALAAWGLTCLFFWLRARRKNDVGR